MIEKLLVPADDTYEVKIKGKLVTFKCHIQDEPDGVAGPSGRHDTNTDIDHGATVIQLMPFFDTPNNGGVYKAWVVTEDQYVANGGDPDAVPSPVKSKGKQIGYDRDDGFGPSRHNIKTDNFKVKGGGKDPCPMKLTVRKFHDANLNGIMDAGEEWIIGWGIDITDPLGITNSYWTVVEREPAVTGTWTTVEETPAGTQQTAATLDGAAVLPLSPTVDVPFACNDTHEVIYGNGCVDGTVTACKKYDANRDGVADGGEAPVSGWQMKLSGTDVTGAVIDRTQFTGADGCTTFDQLLPGDYTVIEVIPTTGGWETLDTNPKPAVVSSSVQGTKPVCSKPQVDFANFCTGTADFGTKGYWHNKNGLAELTDADIAYVNDLLPYSSPSSYFGDGDEPFDGKFQDGTPVGSSLDANGEMVPGGTTKAEVSLFLVDQNAGGDPREQLAQQLLAFIFNVRHRLGGSGATLQLPDGTWVNAGDLINQAINTWSSGTAAEQTTIKTVLDQLNNGDAIPFVHAAPCDVTYP